MLLHIFDPDFSIVFKSDAIPGQYKALKLDKLTFFWYPKGKHAVMDNIGGLIQYLLECIINMKIKTKNSDI